MINAKSVENVLNSRTDSEMEKPLIRNQIAVISDMLDVPVDKVTVIARLALNMGLQWDCPTCDFQDCVSYIDLVNVGNPICPECDREME